MMARPTCTLEGCERVRQAQGLCNTHLRRQQKYGDPLAGVADLRQARQRSVCSTDGCDRFVKAHGLCRLHYLRQRKTDPSYVEMVRASQRRRSPHRAAAKRLRLYGLTQAEFDRMAVMQGGCCAICGEPESYVDPRTGIVSLLSVDHCHATGAVRGLLCRQCNSGLGYLGDSVERLKAALAYLGSH